MIPLIVLTGPTTSGKSKAAFALAKKINTEILLNKIDQLRRDFGTTFLIATHDENVLKHATRILYLENGQIK